MTFEGGYSNHPDDSGLATKYGITEAVAKANGFSGDMRDLTLDFAKSIYRKSYWDACKCDLMPDEIKYALFDAAVNSGVGQASKWLQSSVGVKADGVIGPMTLHAVSAIDPVLIAKNMIGKRLRFMTEIKSWPSFSKGWSRRIAALLEM